VKSETVKLSQAAVELRSTSRAAWDDFLNAVTEYSAAVTNNCVSATPDLLPQAQGRAQNARDFLALMHAAPALVEKLREKNKNNGP
jgi:hypothetical protein